MTDVVYARTWDRDGRSRDTAVRAEYTNGQRRLMIGQHAYEIDEMLTESRRDTYARVDIVDGYVLAGTLRSVMTQLGLTQVQDKEESL